MKDIVQGLFSELLTMRSGIKEYEQKLKSHMKEHEECQRLTEIRGVGLMTATVFVSVIGNTHVFKNGRQFSAWIGLVPKHTGSGGNIRMLGISKRGDRYFRSLLIHGARSVVRTCVNKEDPLSKWINDIRHRSGFNKAVVALANKNARIAWAMLAKGEKYNPNLTSGAIAA